MTAMPTVCLTISHGVQLLQRGPHARGLPLCQRVAILSADIEMQRDLHFVQNILRYVADETPPTEGRMELPLTIPGYQCPERSTSTYERCSTPRKGW